MSKKEQKALKLNVPKKVKSIIAQAEDVEVSIDHIIETARQSLLFLEKMATAKYLEPKYQAKLLALCQHYLDKLTLEKVILMRKLAKLEALQIQAEKAIYRNMLSDLSQLRVSDQKSFIETKLAPITIKIKTIKRALDIIDTFSQNLGQTHWTLTKLQNAVEILVRLEGKS